MILVRLSRHSHTHSIMAAERVSEDIVLAELERVRNFATDRENKQAATAIQRFARAGNVPTENKDELMRLWIALRRVTPDGVG